MNATFVSRETKYCQAIVKYLNSVGHATNAEILKVLRIDFPDLSATTVHRATTRLCSRGEIAAAPSTASGSQRYDANTKPHDHFMCESCDHLRDVSLVSEVKPLIEAQLEGCKLTGQITISGQCPACKRGKS